MGHFDQKSSYLRLRRVKAQQQTAALTTAYYELSSTPRTLSEMSEHSTNLGEMVGFYPFILLPFHVIEGGGR
jgi:hypothetical protein